MSGDLFLLFVSFEGDLEKTLAVSGLSRPDVEALAAKEGWAQRFEQLKLVRAERGPEAMLIELNRHANYQQALKVRDLVGKAVDAALGADVNALLYSQTQAGANFTAKGLSDLAKAVQTVQDLTYKALGDLQGDRKREAEAEGLGTSLAALAVSSQRAVPAPASLAEALDAGATPRAVAFARVAPFQPSAKRKAKAPPRLSLGEKLKARLDLVDAEEDGVIE